MAASPAPDSGPTEAPPSLPPGWIAQWDNTTREYYFVAISTGASMWKVPTEPAPGVPSPHATPMPTENQFQPPAGSTYDGQESDRGLGTMAMGMLMNKQNMSQNQSGFGALAQSLLSGGGTSQGQVGGQQGLTSQLGSLFGPSKPYGSQNLQNPSQSQYGTGQSQQQGGFLNTLLGGAMGHHTLQQQGQGYGYTNQNQNGGYTNSGASSQYQQPGYPQQQQHSFGPSAAPYDPSTYGSQGSQTNQQYPPRPNSNQPPPYYGAGPTNSNPQGIGYGPQQQQPYTAQPQSLYNQSQQQSGGHYGSNGNYNGQQQSPPPYGQQYGGQHNYGLTQPPPASYGGTTGYSQNLGQSTYDHYPPPPPMGSHPGQGGYGAPGGQGGGQYGASQAPQWRP